MVPLKHGHTLQIHVNDPKGLLPAPIGTTGANHLAIHVIGPSGLAQPVPIVSRSATSRDHLLVVPYDTPLKLLIHSSTFALKDAGSKGLNATSTTNFTASSTSPPQLSC